MKDDAQERSHEPTEQRRKKFREKGEIPRSREVTAVVGLAVAAHAATDGAEADKVADRVLPGERHQMVSAVHLGPERGQYILALFTVEAARALDASSVQDTLDRAAAAAVVRVLRRSTDCRSASPVPPERSTALQPAAPTDGN